MARAGARPEREAIGLLPAAQMILEECRMVLPGIQALFGFQLIAVFSERFARDLSAFEQGVHFASIALVVIAIAIIMAPAAYHRRQEPLEVTATFIDVSTVLLLASMLPLAVALCLDFYVIARLIMGNAWALPLAGALFALLFFAWFAFPAMHQLHGLISRKKHAPRAA